MLEKGTTKLKGITNGKADNANSSSALSGT